MRGAPAIGCAAALALAAAGWKIKAEPAEAFFMQLRGYAERLNATRPTAVNLSWALDRCMRHLENLSELPVPALKKELLKEALAILDEGEKNNSREAEAMAATFGDAIAPFFDYEENSFFSHALLEIGSAIGRFSYLRDAYEDRAKDEKKGSYNPLIGLEDDEIGEMLLNAASDASVAFESLPLDDNINLLRNILYGGIWKRTKWESGERNS